MKLFWTVLSGLGILTAAVLLIRGNFDAAFVVGVLAVVCWFLSYRIQMKEITAAADFENKQDDSNEI